MRCAPCSLGAELLPGASVATPQKLLSCSQAETTTAGFTPGASRAATLRTSGGAASTQRRAVLYALSHDAAPIDAGTQCVTHPAQPVLLLFAAQTAESPLDNRAKSTPGES